MYWHTSLFEKIKRYYLGTYIKIPECPTLVSVDNVHPSFVRMTNQDGDIFEVDLNKGYNLEWSLPVNRIYFQHGKHAYMVSRNPQRQYHRGFSSGNTFLSSLGDSGPKAVSLSINILNSIINKAPYESLEAAVWKIREKGFSSVALTHRIAVTKSFVVYVDYTPVGYYQWKKKKLFCLPEFSPILYDFLKNTGDSVTLVEQSEL